MVAVSFELGTVKTDHGYDRSTKIFTCVCDWCGKSFTRPEFDGKGRKQKFLYDSLTCSGFAHAEKANAASAAKRRELYEPNFWKKVDKTPGHGPKGDCWFWTGKNGIGGYGTYGSAGAKGSHETTRAHRISYIFTHGKIPGGMDLLHSCNETICVNPAHLRPGTRKENMEQAAKEERMIRGHDVWNSKFEDPQVRDIYFRHHIQKHRISELTREFNVCRTTIDSILKNKTWKHLGLQQELEELLKNKT